MAWSPGHQVNGSAQAKKIEQHIIMSDKATITCKPAIKYLYDMMSRISDLDFDPCYGPSSRSKYEEQAISNQSLRLE